MDMAVLRAFFGWCAIMNGGLLILTFLILVGGREFVYRMHSKMFPMTREAFYAIIYAFLGIYKTCWIVFNLVPYLALAIIG